MNTHPKHINIVYPTKNLQSHQQQQTEYDRADKHKEELRPSVQVGTFALHLFEIFNYLNYDCVQKQ